MKLPKKGQNHEASKEEKIHLKFQWSLDNVFDTGNVVGIDKITCHRYNQILQIFG